MLTSISDQPGSLFEVLKYFWKYEISITHIESRPAKDDDFIVYIDFIDSKNTNLVIDELKRKSVCKNVLVLDPVNVPWFPKHISDLDKVANRILMGGTDLHSDHPGFHDTIYKQRRSQLTQISMDYKYGDEIPTIDYTTDEINIWGCIFQRLEESHKTNACREYKDIVSKMKSQIGYSANAIPQLKDINEFLSSRSGFKIRPVAGLLSSRDFLNGLAHRVFFSTPYIRHQSKPLYTPEPDIIHEIIGHVPLLADGLFADFSQQLGLSSLGASDEEIKKLASCYWYSVEFGLVQENNGLKAYGAGLLSSIGELAYATEGKTASYIPFDPNVAAVTDFPITDYQHTYFVAKDFQDMKQKMIAYAENMRKPFLCRYNSVTNTVFIDRAVRRNDI